MLYLFSAKVFLSLRDSLSKTVLQQGCVLGCFVFWVVSKVSNYLLQSVFKHFSHEGTSVPLNCNFMTIKLQPRSLGS